jgi:hypothetical protein
LHTTAGLKVNAAAPRALLKGEPVDGPARVISIMIGP